MTVHGRAPAISRVSSAKKNPQRSRRRCGASTLDFKSLERPSHAREESDSRRMWMDRFCWCAGASEEAPAARRAKRQKSPAGTNRETVSCDAMVVNT